MGGEIPETWKNFNHSVRSAIHEGLDATGVLKYHLTPPTPLHAQDSWLTRARQCFHDQGINAANLETATADQLSLAWESVKALKDENPERWALEINPCFAEPLQKMARGRFLGNSLLLDAFDTHPVELPKLDGWTPPPMETLITPLREEVLAARRDYPGWLEALKKTTFERHRHILFANAQLQQELLAPHSLPEEISAIKNILQEEGIQLNDQMHPHAALKFEGNSACLERAAKRLEKLSLTGTLKQKVGDYSGRLRNMLPFALKEEELISEIHAQRFPHDNPSFYNMVQEVHNHSTSQWKDRTPFFCWNDPTLAAAQQPGSAIISEGTTQSLLREAEEVKGGGKTRWIVGGIIAATVVVGAYIGWRHKKTKAGQEQERRRESSLVEKNVITP